VAGYHRWHNLLFAHWRVDPAAVADLLPAGLTLDTFDGSAWVGLIPFRITGLRPWWSPPLPGLSSFNEINVRTYVHYRGRDPGVWFFSLDANSALAVNGARWLWKLNYYRARMKVERVGATMHYQANRRNRPEFAASITARIGGLLGENEFGRPLPAGAALPGTLEHFLIERYILYSQMGASSLRKASVHHFPYRLRQVDLLSCDQTLTAAAGIPLNEPPCHVLYSKLARVEVFPLQPV
jgi:uncharacterized protein YqjF (DUF2071 family)